MDYCIVLFTLVYKQVALIDTQFIPQEAGVGKTSLLNRFVKGSWDPHTSTTIGLDNHARSYVTF